MAFVSAFGVWDETDPPEGLADFPCLKAVPQSFVAPTQSGKTMVRAIDPSTFEAGTGGGPVGYPIG